MRVEPVIVDGFDASKAVGWTPMCKIRLAPVKLGETLAVWHRDRGASNPRR